MSDYIKKVVYLSYRKNGERIKGAGFIKLEYSSGVCRLKVHIAGMGHLPDGRYEIKAVTDPAVVLSGEEKMIGTICLRSGLGEWDGEIKEEDIAFHSIRKFLVVLSSCETAEGILAEGNGKQSGHPIVEKPEKLEKPLKKPTVRFLKKPELKAAAEASGEVKEEKKASNEERKKGIKEETSIGTNNIRGKTDCEKEKREEDKLEKVILSDKWEQLRQLYPVVHPYEDEREYITIKPKDFVIMTGDYQHLANNSFLLHGFYNYRHIILGKEPGNEKEDGFYLGVPGVYYEREKMVALMFGFEAFECAKGKAEPGEFGYYLKKVKI